MADLTAAMRSLHSIGQSSERNSSSAFRSLAADETKCAQKCSKTHSNASKSKQICLREKANVFPMREMEKQFF
jgi:hypothetical protein